MAKKIEDKILEDEYFKEIKGYEGEYMISNYGRVFSIKRNLIMKSQKKQNGYLNIKLTKKNKPKYYYLHRLVALNFIENKENKPDVNHKNMIKDDNRISNLEWVTKSENSKHSSKHIKVKTNTHRKYNINKIDGEIWKTIKGHEKYKISNYGRIISFNKKKPILLKYKNTGYYNVSLNSCYYLVHRLVLLTFINNKDKEKNIVNHINGDKLDNRLVNLEWCTIKENSQKYQENNKDKIKKGSECKYSKLDENKVKEIFQHKGLHKEIADKYNISRQSVSSIKQRRSWKHITKYL